MFLQGIFFSINIILLAYSNCFVFAKYCRFSKTYISKNSTGLSKATFLLQVLSGLSFHCNLSFFICNNISFCVICLCNYWENLNYLCRKRHICLCQYNIVIQNVLFVFAKYGQI